MEQWSETLAKRGIKCEEQGQEDSPTRVGLCV